MELIISARAKIKLKKVERNLLLHTKNTPEGKTNAESYKTYDDELDPESTLKSESPTTSPLILDLLLMKAEFRS